jgi:hypothetical protein
MTYSLAKQMLLGIIVPFIFLAELGATVLLHLVLSKLKSDKFTFKVAPYCR